jgi:hypothetical protein
MVVRTREPYTLQEKGWGAFDLRIIFHFVDNLVAPQLMWFDLNFAQEAYSISDTLVSEFSFLLVFCVGCCPRYRPKTNLGPYFLKPCRYIPADPWGGGGFHGMH